MSVIIQYFNLQKKYEKEYGEKTVLLMQIGSFYECYEFDPSLCVNDEAKIEKGKQGAYIATWNEKVGHAAELSIVLNCALASEDNSEPHSIRNPWKLGFPCLSYDKNIKPLLANDWTIVRMDQIKTNGKIERIVGEVVSPTTQLDSISLNRCTNNILSIYIEYQGQSNKNKYENFLITTGVSVVDIITGNNKVCEFYSKTEDEVSALQELFRFIISHYPREVILNVVDLPKGLDYHSPDAPNPYVKFIESVLELKKYDKLTTHVNTVDADYKKISYQVEFFNKIFSENDTSKNIEIIKQTNAHIISHLGVDRMNYGRLSYMILLQHIYRHNKNLLSRLSRPDVKWIDENKKMILTHNAIVQLDLVSNDILSGKLPANNKKKEFNSLMSVLDNCCTQLGRRSLSNLLQNPMRDAADIEIYYEMVNEMLTETVDDKPLWHHVDSCLNELPDIERIQRKLEIKVITPKELSVLLRSYIKITQLYVTITKLKTPTLHMQMFGEDETLNFNNYLSTYLSIFDLSGLDTCSFDSGADENDTDGKIVKWLNFTKPPINIGVNNEIDNITNSLVEAETQLENIINHFDKLLEATKGQKVVVNNQKSKKKGALKLLPKNTLLTTTTAKAHMLMHSGYDENICGKLESATYSTSEKIITSDVIASICSKIDNSKQYLRNKFYTMFLQFIDDMQSYTFYTSIVNFIMKLDVVHSYACASYRYNYYRPVVSKSEGDSYFEAKNVRHPIIERIIEGEYVVNDITLATQNDTTEEKFSKGILLFGTNAVGKSSLTKSIALCIIMAQIGCYTPAIIKYRPYSKIITRLNGNDSLRESSFQIEMSELRTILRQADNKTLCLADEIAKGTESDSATGITVATILKMIEVKSSFIIASHMHNLVELDYIKNIPPTTLKVCHMDIIYDEKTGGLIYNRKLKDGSGSSLYGILVAKSLGLPGDFIEKANEVVSFVTGENEKILSTKKSRYNSNVYVSECTLCKKTCKQIPLHAHHIKEQHLADQRGLINNMHKNTKGNLIVLCESCHKFLHSSGLQFEKVDTPSGSMVVIAQ